jgi:hypothetical protein
MDSKVSFKVQDGQLIVAVDSNADGKPVVTVALDLAQVIAEIASALKK